MTEHANQACRMCISWKEKQETERVIFDEQNSEYEHSILQHFAEGPT